MLALVLVLVLVVVLVLVLALVLVLTLVLITVIAIALARSQLLVLDIHADLPTYLYTTAILHLSALRRTFAVLRQGQLRCRRRLLLRGY